MPYYIPKRKMFISKANPDDKREFFSGFNICYGRNQKMQRLTYTVLSVLRWNGMGGHEQKDDEMKLNCLSCKFNWKSCFPLHINTYYFFRINIYLGASNLAELV